jgi:predicted ATPase/DNA-binding SARP family transcriptional activator
MVDRLTGTTKGPARTRTKGAKGYNCYQSDEGKYQRIFDETLAGAVAQQRSNPHTALYRSTSRRCILIVPALRQSRTSTQLDAEFVAERFRDAVGKLDGRDSGSVATGSAATFASSFVVDPSPVGGVGSRRRRVAQHVDSRDGPARHRPSIFQTAEFLIAQPSTLVVRVFGEPSCTANDVARRIGGPPRTIALLLFLVVRRKAPMERRRIAFALWPDVAEDEALSNLRRHLHALVTALPPRPDGNPWLAVSRVSVQWAAGSGAFVDTIAFEEALDAGDDEAAVSLYAGPLAPSVDEEWLTFERERLAALVQSAYDRLIERDRRHDTERAIRFATQALALDPWRESIVRALIELRSLAGDAAAARRQYHEFAQRIKQEFDALPDPQTTAAYERIASVAAERTHEDQPPVAPSQPAPRATFANNLPHKLTTFVGRDEVAAEIGTLIGRHPLLTLVGAGGVGKTRCAVEVAGQLLDGSGDGVWFVELAALGDPTLVTAAIATVLNVEERPDRSLLETLLGFLKRKRLLLILDNCEHVIGEVRHVASCIARDCPEVRIVVTTREPLNLAEERVYRMPSLTVPAAADVSVAEAARYGAVQLFADRARRPGTGFALDEASIRDVAEICRRLDGIPLAIELAAARITVLTPKQILQKLDARFRILTGGDRAALPRQQTMRALIDWSYDLLSPDERKIFRTLAVFAGGCTLDTAHAVCGNEALDDIAVLDLISSLVDKSLVQAEPHAGQMRYRLLESTRDYAHEKLVAHGEEATAADAHAVAFLALAERLERAYEETPDHLWLEWVTPELDNWRRAFAWANGCAFLRERLAGALRWVFAYLAPSEGRRWTRIALESAHASAPPAVLAKLDLIESMHASALKDFKSSLAAAERAVERYRSIGETYGAIEAERRAGSAEIYLGRLVEGEQRLENVLPAARAENGGPKTLGHIIRQLAQTRLLSRDFAGARQRFLEAYNVFKAAGADWPVAIVAGDLAELAFLEGDSLGALRFAGEALDGARAGNHLPSVAAHLENTSAYLIPLARYDEARDYARQALALARELEIAYAFYFALQHLAAVAAMRSDATSDDVRRAAQLLGFVEGRLERAEILREFTEQHEYDAIRATLRRVFDETELAALMREGRAWTEDQAFGEALLC